MGCENGPFLFDKRGRLFRIGRRKYFLVSMNAEYNDWSVTIYADVPEDISLLRSLLERARKAGVECCSVGIIPIPDMADDVGSAETVKFVGFSHKTWGEIKELVLQDGIPLDLVPKRVRSKWGSPHLGPRRPKMSGLSLVVA